MPQGHGSRIACTCWRIWWVGEKRQRSWPIGDGSWHLQFNRDLCRGATGISSYLWAGAVDAPHGMGGRTGHGSRAHPNPQPGTARGTPAAPALGIGHIPLSEVPDLHQLLLEKESNSRIIYALENAAPTLQWPGQQAGMKEAMDGLAAIFLPNTWHRLVNRHYSDFVQDDKLGALDPKAITFTKPEKHVHLAFNWLHSVWMIRNWCVFSLKQYKDKRERRKGEIITPKLYTER